jgi:myo-inositol catabolism protein IolC
LNRRQLQRLRQLSEYLHSSGRSLFMVEMLVPPEKAQLDRVGGDKEIYDFQIRPSLMTRAIQQFQEAQVEPDIWKLEGLDRREDCVAVAEAARRGGRDRVGCIVLGRGENYKNVREWLATAAAVPGFTGFAVGRTTFWEALVKWRAKSITRDAAVTIIANRYRDFVDIFEFIKDRAA